MEITTDRKYIITGAGGGIAGSIIEVFAEAGARLALVDISSDAITLRAGACGGVAITADLTDQSATSAMVAEAQDRLGGVDGLIHTTGGFATAAAVDNDSGLYQRLFDLNVRTLVVTTAAVLPVLLERGHGFLAGFSAAPGWYRSSGAGMSIYAAAKAAVATFLHAIQDEVGPQGVTSAVVYPMGVVDTDANRKAMPDADRAKWIDPAEIGRAILFAAVSGPRGRLTELPIFPAA